MHKDSLLMIDSAILKTYLFVLILCIVMKFLNMHLEWSHNSNVLIILWPNDNNLKARLLNIRIIF